ncbi:OmpW/AlkL family protein [Xanthomarina sp. F2636L]|uniref:OmpW/AlkL family protein n=1 Tax=Xanthomarina sp. F2636L TaxID=2996018 RepID=UPI00225E4EB3|nr:OmpW family outer membrane protein [Xanthomarina sp. F2636L]MCX7552164.1 outer membrane beta-barrel protein [Xanthomarina sp. F2636L]
MKKIIFSALIAFLFVFNAQAQEASSSSQDYSKWQARFRIISVIPSPGDNLDGLDVDISTSFVPELDFTYFFTKNIAAELILGTTKHDVEVGDNLSNIDLGHVWLLPPTLNLQYHFYAGDFKPYVGAGINYTIFYGVDEGDVAGMDYENSFGFSFQAGVDYSLNDKWFLNLDLKQLLLSTDVDVDTGAGVLPVEVDINPFIIGLGVGRKF